MDNDIYDMSLRDDVEYGDETKSAIYLGNGQVISPDTNTKYSRYTYFEEDLLAFDQAIIKANYMYDMFETELNKITGSGKKGYGSLVSSIRDKAELGKAVDGLGKTVTDLIKSKAQLKKQSIELELKEKESVLNQELKIQKLNEDGSGDGGDMISQFTDLVKEINKTNSNITSVEKNVLRERIAGVSTIEDDSNDLALLDASIETDIINGEIEFTQNDKAMKYDAMGIVEYQYEKETGDIIPVNITTGLKIDDYPLTRIPQGYKTIVKIHETTVDTMIGSVPVYGGSDGE